MSRPSPRRLPWHKSIGVRTALVVAVAVLIFDQLRPLVDSLVAREFGVPERFLLRNDSWIVDELLIDAYKVADGRLEPDPDIARIFDGALAAQGFAYLWLDMEGAIVSLSASLPWQLDEVWPDAFEQYFQLPASEVGGAPDEPEIRGIGAIIEREGVEAGYYLELLIDREQHAAWHGITVEELATEPACDYGPHYELVSPLSEEEFEASVRFWERASTLLGFAFKALTVLLVAFVLSRVVTRRVARLSRESAGSLDAGHVPGPFTDSGNDEIGVLASSLNGMRERILELVGSLEQRDAERRQWIAQVSHDLRTPLTALGACLDRAQSVLDGLPDGTRGREQLSEVIGVARMDAERMGILTEDLLEVARLDAHASLSLEPVPPGELVRQAVRGLGLMAEAHGISVSSSIEPGLPTPLADGRRLIRAIENLMRNAIQHAQSSVVVQAGPIPGGVRFEVQDDGPGVPETDGVVVLEELRHLHSRRDSAGLGLEVAEKVALAHGGRIGAYNREAGGAAFWIEVPVGENEPEAQEAELELQRRPA